MKNGGGRPHQLARLPRMARHDVIIVVIRPIPAGGRSLLLADICSEAPAAHIGPTAGAPAVTIASAYSGANRLKIIEHSVFSPSAE